MWGFWWKNDLITHDEMEVQHSISFSVPYLQEYFMHYFFTPFKISEIQWIECLHYCEIRHINVYSIAIINKNTFSASV